MTEKYCYRDKIKRGEIAGKVLIYIILTLVVIVILFPLFWAISSSLRPDEEIFKYVTPFSAKAIFPQNPTIQAYKNLFTVRKFYIPIKNTIIVAVINIVLGCIVNAFAGFAFAKFDFKFKKPLFVLVMLSFMVPFESIAIPLYSLINKLNWVDTYYALLAPAIANGLAIFLFKQFFEDIPDSIIESATIDGAGWMTIFFNIVLPLSVPVTITACLMIFMGQWESFMWPLIAARSTNLKMIQVALTDFQMEHTTLWSELFAASIVTAIIPILFLLPFQKFYVQGVTDAGVKE